LKRLFISDLHLMESRPDVTAAFFRFLGEHAVDADELYILGDFFELWLGDDHETDFNRSIIDALGQLETPRFLMHGNRDFLMGDDFARAAGATLLPDPTVIDAGGKPVLLMHGDSMCTRDEAYMQARKMLRDPAFQQDFLSKSIAERAALAQGARNQSREHTRETADDIMDVTPAEVVREMEAHGVDLLIHGHTHRPYVHEFTLGGRPARRIVLGDWDDKGWYLVLDDAGFELKSFRI